MTYMVKVQLGNYYYMTKVDATSNSNAENKILNMGVVGKHQNAVNGSLAFDKKAIKTDFFYDCLADCKMIDINELEKIINKRNGYIIAADEAEERILANERKMAAMKKEMEELEKQLIDDRNTFAMYKGV